jgi:hypothetical protein
MTHQEAFSLMMEALDGILTPSGEEWLEQHLALCAECQIEWDALRFVDRLFASAAPIPAPAGFVRRVQARIEHPSWERSLGVLFALSLGSLAALLLVAAPASVTLLGLWTAFSQPAQFADLLLWLGQLGRVSGSLLDALWTALRLFSFEAAGSPIVLGWALAAGAAVVLWAHVIRRPALVQVKNS